MLRDKDLEVKYLVQVHTTDVQRPGTGNQIGVFRKPGLFLLQYFHLEKTRALPPGFNTGSPQQAF